MHPSCRIWQRQASSSSFAAAAASSRSSARAAAASSRSSARARTRRSPRPTVALARGNSGGGTGGTPSGGVVGGARCPVQRRSSVGHARATRRSHAANTASAPGRRGESAGSLPRRFQRIKLECRKQLTSPYSTVFFSHSNRSIVCSATPTWCASRSPCRGRRSSACCTRVISARRVPVSTQRAPRFRFRTRGARWFLERAVLLIGGQPVSSSFSMAAKAPLRRGRRGSSCFSLFSMSRRSMPTRERDGRWPRLALGDSSCGSTKSSRFRILARSGSVGCSRERLSSAAVKASDTSSASAGSATPARFILAGRMRVCASPHKQNGFKVTVVCRWRVSSHTYCEGRTEVRRVWFRWFSFFDCYRSLVDYVYSPYGRLTSSSASIDRLL